MLKNTGFYLKSPVKMLNTPFKPVFSLDYDYTKILYIVVYRFIPHDLVEALWRGFLDGMGRAS